MPDDDRMSAQPFIWGGLDRAQFGCEQACAKLFEDVLIAEDLLNWRIHVPAKDNRRRIFSDLLSLDAWHDPFALANGTAGVFAEVSFSDGRMGGDDSEIPFTFSVSLKRAILTIRLEEPLSIDRTTVARGIPAKQAEYTQILRAKDEVRKHVGMTGAVTPALITAALKGDISKSSEVTKEDELRVVQTMPEIVVTARPEGPQAYSWELEPFTSRRLKGQPWDPLEPPRMRVVLPPSSNIDPSVKVEVRCALEDIEITSLEPKDDSLIERIRGRNRQNINEAAAIQHLKKVLTDVDLHPSNLDNRFNSVLLADVLAHD